MSLLASASAILLRIGPLNRSRRLVLLDQSQSSAVAKLVTTAHQETPVQSSACCSMEESIHFQAVVAGALWAMASVALQGVLLHSLLRCWV